MPMLLDTESRTDALVCAVNDVLVHHGPAGLTLRRIARASGVSTSSILHHLESREHLLRVSAHRTGQQRLAALRAESCSEGVLAFVPRSPGEVLGTRAWLAWLELWRSEASLERIISEARDEERWLLARALDLRVPRPDLDGVMALVDGLRVALCSPRDPMAPDVACSILATQVHTLRRTRADTDVTPPPVLGSTR